MRSQTVAEPVKEIVLGRFIDVVELNAFVASRPEHVTLTYKTSKLARVWELEIDGKSTEWSVGHIIDGYGDVAPEYSVAVERRRRGYIDAKLIEGLQELYVVRWKGGHIFATLPNESEKKVIIAAPQVCGRVGNVLMEPVYIWKDEAGWYEVLDCRSGLHIFTTLDELESWLWENAEGGKLPWSEWYVVPGTVLDEDEWLNVIKRAEVSEFGPTLDEVLEQVLKLTG